MSTDSGLTALHTVIAAFAGRYEWSSLDVPVRQYANQLRTAEDVDATTYKLLKLLLATRQYACATLIADASLAVAPTDKAVQRNYAQALVDSGRIAPALRIYTDVAESPSSTDHDRAEAIGGVGRCYKQLLLDEQNAERKSKFLVQGLHAYRQLYDADNRLFWHGINATALLSYADREGISVAGVEDPGASARETAAAVLAEIARLKKPNSWAYATACEAHIARREDEAALEYAKKFVEALDTNAFSIASLLRQIETVWKISPESPLGTTLLPVLRSTLAKLQGGSVWVGTKDITEERLDKLDNLEHAVEGPMFERVFGRDRFQTLRWWRRGLMRCRAVVRIDDVNGDAIGSGFLVNGKTLHDNLPDLVVVTNCHVVPDAVGECDAVAAFLGLDEDDCGNKRFEVKRLCWHSPAGRPGLDTAILELECYPDVDPMPLSPELRLTNDATRAYVIGHPRGYDQPQFSIQDNLLIDHDDSRLHYRSPTEGGSSGSPVFDERWNVIGLHHAGSATMSRLSGRGTHQANEALRIDAIRRALEDDPPIPDALNGRSRRGPQA